MAEDETEITAKARVGSVINGKWTVDRLIGVGGMASVYAATHRNSKKAALKIMHPELSAQASIRERFLREGYLSNLVDHPGVVTVDDDDETEDGCAFLVMELVEGETLEARLRRKGPLPPEEVLSFMDQVLHALATAHTRGVVHRDLKPENILLAQSGEVKLLDFGIARARALSTDPTKTLTEGLMGTPAFMPPEQARGRWEEVDAQSDVWALGATMFTLLTGRNVHQAATTNEALAVAMMRRAPRLEEYRPDLPSFLLELVNKALSYEKKDRWPNATVMLLAVRKATSRWEVDSLRAEAAAAALAVSADADFDGYMPEEDESGSRGDSSAPDVNSAVSEPPSSVHESAPGGGYELVLPEPQSAAPAPVDELPTNPVSSSGPLAPPSHESASDPVSVAAPVAPAAASAAAEVDYGALDADATPIAAERDRPSLTASAAPQSTNDPASPSQNAGASRTEETGAFPPRDSAPMIDVAGSPALPASATLPASTTLPASAVASSGPESGPEAAARYLSRRASTRDAEAASSGELPARRVVPFSDVRPPTSSEMVLPTETTTARGALTARVRNTSRSQRSLIGGATVAALLLVAIVFSASWSNTDVQPEPAAHANAAPRADVPAAPEERGQQALDEEPSGADPDQDDADEVKTAQESLKLEALPMLSASSADPTAPAPVRHWRPKAKAEKAKVNIFNKAKNLAVKRATVRSDKVKSGTAE
jgi:serine/threonine-protein kinase